jgi:small subunit ribosomal protein S2
VVRYKKRRGDTMGLFNRLFGKKGPAQQASNLEPVLEPQKAPEAPKTKPVPTLEKVSQDIKSGKVTSMNQKPAPKKPASSGAQKPAAKKPAAKKPAAKKPAAKKPAAKKPAAKKPAAKK